jgi:hypothetical protein
LEYWKRAEDWKRMRMREWGGVKGREKEYSII